MEESSLSGSRALLSPAPAPAQWALGSQRTLFGSVRRSQGCFLEEIVPGLCFERTGMGWLEEERFQTGGGICAKAWRVQACLLFRAMLCCSSWFFSGIFISTSSRSLPLYCFLFHSILFPYMTSPCPCYKLPSFCQ